MSTVAIDTPIPAFLKDKVTFADGHTYHLLRPLTDYRSCHDGEPSEARMVFLCARAGTAPAAEEELIMKVKVQLPGVGQVAHKGPSTTTAAELEALQIFRDAGSAVAPQLVAYHSEAQNADGPVPGGFITFTVMTKLPGQSLFTRYWSMPAQERDDILSRVVIALRSIYELGVQPIDRGLRNVMWCADSKHCGIIDFELWNPVATTFTDDKTEMERWGLLRTPPAKDHFLAFQAMYR